MNITDICSNVRLSTLANCRVRVIKHRSKTDGLQITLAQDVSDFHVFTHFLSIPPRWRHGVVTNSMTLSHLIRL